jgi:hypothetical protein
MRTVARAVCAGTAADGAPMATQRNVAQMRMPAQTDPMMAMQVGQTATLPPGAQVGAKFDSFGSQTAPGNEFAARYMADLLFPLPFPVVVVIFQIWFACIANLLSGSSLADAHVFQALGQLLGWTMLLWFLAVDAGFLRLFGRLNHRTIFGYLPGFKFVTFEPSPYVTALYFFLVFGIFSWFCVWLSDLFYLPQPCPEDDSALLKKWLLWFVTGLFAVCYLLARVTRVQHELDLTAENQWTWCCMRGSFVAGDGREEYLKRNLSKADYTMTDNQATASNRTPIVLLADTASPSGTGTSVDKNSLKNGTALHVLGSWLLLLLVLNAQFSLFGYVQELRFDTLLTHTCNLPVHSWGMPNAEGIRTTRAHGKFAIGKTYEIDSQVHMPCPVAATCDLEGSQYVPHATNPHGGHTPEQLKQQDMWNVFVAAYSTETGETWRTHEETQTAMFTGWSTGFGNAHESLRSACGYKYLPPTGSFTGNLSNTTISYADVANCRPGGMLLDPEETQSLLPPFSFNAKSVGDQDLYGQQLAVSCPYGLAAASCCDPLYNPSHWSCVVVPFTTYWNPRCNCKANAWPVWHAIFAPGMDTKFNANGETMD